MDPSASIHDVVLTGDAVSVEALINAWDENKDKSQLINHANNEGYSPIHLAVANCDYEITKLRKDLLRVEAQLQGQLSKLVALQKQLRGVVYIVAILVVFYSISSIQGVYSKLHASEQAIFSSPSLEGKGKRLGFYSASSSHILNLIVGVVVTLMTISPHIDIKLSKSTAQLWSIMKMIGFIAAVIQLLLFILFQFWALSNSDISSATTSSSFKIPPSFLSFLKSTVYSIPVVSLLCSNKVLVKSTLEGGFLASFLYFLPILTNYIWFDADIAKLENNLLYLAKVQEDLEKDRDEKKVTDVANVTNDKPSSSSSSPSDKKTN